MIYLIKHYHICLLLQLQLLLMASSINATKTLIAHQHWYAFHQTQVGSTPSLHHHLHISINMITSKDLTIMLNCKVNHWSTFVVAALWVLGQGMLIFTLFCLFGLFANIDDPCIIFHRMQVINRDQHMKILIIRSNSYDAIMWSYLVCYTSCIVSFCLVCTT